MKRFQVLQWAGDLLGFAALLGFLAAAGIAIYGLWRFGFYWELLVQVALVAVGSFFSLAMADGITLLLDLHERLYPAVQLPLERQTASERPAAPATPAPGAARRPN